MYYMNSYFFSRGNIYKNPLISKRKVYNDETDSLNLKTMQIIRRIFFFLLTNIAILLLLGIVLTLVGFFFPELLSQTGNSFGGLLIYAAIFGFAGSFISLWISRWMAKSAYGIVLLDRTSASRDAKLELVWNTVERIAQANHIAMPEVGYYESADPNAFATGASKNSSLVAVSTGLLNAMDKNEIE